ncbi:MAG: site-2 protease family protein [Planctomycetota bacterium]
MNWEHMILLFVTLIISLTVHEAAHALFAFLGGDRTAYRGGQMTLNPAPHMRREPFGMLILPAVSLVVSQGTYCFGYAHAPIDPYWAARHPKRAALMSLAGPLANVLLAAIAFAVLYAIGRPSSGTEEAVKRIADAFLFLNLLLAVFNILPLPPLDGAGVVQGLVPKSQRLYDSLMRIPYSGIVIFVLLINVMPYLFQPVYATVLRWLRAA